MDGIDEEDGNIPCTDCGWLEGMGCPFTARELKEEKAEEQRQRVNTARRLREEADRIMEAQ